MNSSTVEKQSPSATHVQVNDTTLSVDLSDGRTISVPIAWYPRLSHGKTEEREPPVWNILKTLPEDIFSNITMLLLLTPKEAESSLANLEFNDPLPSRR
jgi:hypothetical protein